MRKYDYKKAIEIIEAEKQNLVNVYLGMYEDWFYTADEVWANNKYKKNLEKEPEIGGIRCSYWATPTIKLIFANDEEKMIECYIGEQDGEKPVWLELGCLSAPCQYSLPPIEKWEKNEDK